MENIILLSLTFFCVSTFFSMIGMGGGILYVPILLFAGYTMKTAPSISLILILATSLAALFRFHKNNLVDWKLAIVMDPPTDIMAFVGGYYSSLLPENYPKILLIIILIIAGLLMMNPKRDGGLKLEKNKFYYWHREFNGHKYVVNVPLVILSTALIGIISGILGITGGVIKLPIMVLLCGVPMGIAIATSTVMVALTALFGLFGHALQGNVDYKIGLTLAIAALLGGLLGSKISLNVNKGKLKKIFSIVLLLIACKFIYSLYF
jgi:uncharacterized membrane protein YfcA